MAQFRELLSDGKLGDVRLGMRPEAVVQFLGMPDDRSVKSRPVEILKFGSIELAFKHIPDTNDSRLVSIAIYFFNPKRKLPPPVAFKDWTPTSDTTEPQFLEFLRSAGLQAESGDNGESKSLILRSGASIAFVDGHLYSVHLRHADRRATRRQMSVSLPESTLTQLRDRAKREKVSLQELIERVLSTAS